MKYLILEDCSPFYIRFIHDGIDNIISKCLGYIEGIKFTKPFTHHKYPIEEATDILNSVPLINQLKLNKNRVSLFVSQPGLYYRAHKDGTCNKYSINYTVKILDNDCITSWYSDADLSSYEIDPLKIATSRECLNFDKTKHIPLKSMVAVEGECILFNTEIFHDFDNSKSTNERMILTLRDINPEIMYFENAKKNIFG